MEKVLYSGYTDAYNKTGRVLVVGRERDQEYDDDDDMTKLELELQVGFIVKVPNCVFTTHRIKYYGMPPRHGVGIEHEMK